MTLRRLTCTFELTCFLPHQLRICCLTLGQSSKFINTGAKRAEQLVLAASSQAIASTGYCYRLQPPARRALPLIGF